MALPIPSPTQQQEIAMLGLLGRGGPQKLDPLTISLATASVQGALGGLSLLESRSARKKAEDDRKKAQQTSNAQNLSTAVADLIGELTFKNRARQARNNAVMALTQSILSNRASRPLVV